jgi:hypothetical protein
MQNDNKNIDSEAERRKAEYYAKYLAGTEPTSTKLEKEIEKEIGIFSSMNEVSEGDSHFFRKIILTIFTILVVVLGKSCYEYIKNH